MSHMRLQNVPEQTLFNVLTAYFSCCLSPYSGELLSHARDRTSETRYICKVLVVCGHFSHDLIGRVSSAERMNNLLRHIPTNPGDSKVTHHHSLLWEKHTLNQMLLLHRHTHTHRKTDTHTQGRIQ